jgi:NAD(P)-dependent dehydrogenase (short-subunit alcohol dehydrogenase family)
MPETVVITGASAGVGRATAREFAIHGARIALLARDRDRLETAAEEVRSLGGQALPLPLDVADAAALDAAADTIEQTFGPIDIWINNAMVTVFSPADQLTAEELQRVTNVTYLGTAFGTLAAVRRMKSRDRGTIVQVGSALAYRSIPLQAAYCAAKHAIVGFTDSLRTELLHDHSRVHLTVVHMPALNTPQFSWGRSRLPNLPQPVPPIFQPEVAARAIYWAAHHRRREVLVGGPTVVAVLGNKLAPGIGDRYLARTAYKAQQRDVPAPPDRPDNLFQPVPGPYAAHGEFDGHSSWSSPELWLTQHRRLLLAAGALLTTALLARHTTRSAPLRERKAA